MQQLERREPEGLSEAAAAARLLRDGPNLLPVRRTRPLWLEAVGQLTHFFALMLWVAGVLAFVAGLPQLGVAIFVVVLANGAFAFAQEHRAQRAAERLRDLLPKRATVIRGGRRFDVDAAELVIGDLVVLEAGDRISADMRIERAAAAMLGTAALTGESVPVGVDAGDEALAGTFLVEGEATGIVTATGTDTRLAGIAALTTSAGGDPTPLTIELHRLVRTVALIAAGVGALFLGLSLLIGISLTDAFLFAIGVVVALVPEGLLPTVTLSLAIGAQRMAQRHALVRRLDAVETLGSTTFICTDKTGTLTRNEMAAVEVWTPAGTARIEGQGYEPNAQVFLGPEMDEEPLRLLALVAARCSSGHADLREGMWLAIGDPMDAAVDVLARRVGVDVEGDRKRRPEIERFPFDPRRRLVSLAAGDRLFVKGAPDTLLARCRHAPDSAEGAVDELTARGLRVIAVGTRPLDEVPVARDAAERDLELLGLIGLLDPPRPEVMDALTTCRRAGIRVAMVTGDHPATAMAVARRVGLAGPGEMALIGDELPDDDEVLGAILDRDGIVLARVSPEQKLRIARALRSRGHVVAMTGDGVNDGPALQAADIGVAMGLSGTDVAREAADLVLLNDDFGTIVGAIEQGRATFGNIRRFLTYHLTDNVAELAPFVVWALSGGRFPLALGVLQILALDIGTDTLPAVALGAEPPAARTLDGPPVRGRLLDRTVAVRALGIAGPIEALLGMGAFLLSMLASGWRPGDAFPTGAPLLAASGATFATVVLGQMANAFACRSATQPPWRIAWLSNPLLILAVAIELVVALGASLYWEPLAAMLDQSPPPTIGWIVAASAVTVILMADAAFKRIFRRRLTSTDRP
ncbi:MAG TPA: cation-transporting P-type ATPase [Actinomycetota bacterium]